MCARFRRQCVCVCVSAHHLGAAITNQTIHLSTVAVYAERHQLMCDVCMREYVMVRTIYLRIFAVGAHNTANSMNVFRYFFDVRSTEAAATAAAPATSCL